MNISVNSIVNSKFSVNLHACFRLVLRFEPKLVFFILNSSVTFRFRYWQHGREADEEVTWGNNCYFFC